MSYHPKIIAFAGSTRKDSYNKKLVKISAEGARRADADVTYIDLRDYPLPLYDADLEAQEGLPSNAQRLKELFLEHDGLLLATPEYNSSLPAVLKNTIDWISRKGKDSEPMLACFKGKTASIMSASPSDLGGLRSLLQARAILENIMVMVLPPHLTIPNADQAFDANGQLINGDLQRQAMQRGRDLAEVLAKLHA
ncbi:MAG: NADPH-dependent FMN reductase [Chlamydiota bacterium]